MWNLILSVLKEGTTWAGLAGVCTGVGLWVTGQDPAQGKQLIIAGALLIVLKGRTLDELRKALSGKN